MTNRALAIIRACLKLKLIEFGRDSELYKEVEYALEEIEKFNKRGIK